VRLVAALLLWVSAAAGQTSSPGYSSYRRADQLFVSRRFPECQQALEEALRLDPKLVPALTLKAKLAMAMNRYDVARETLERAVAADPAAWYARFLYGFQFYQQSEMPAAIASFEKARALNPRDGRTLLYLGLAKESLGRGTEALEHYREAIRLEEAAGKLDTETVLTASRLLLLLGEYQESAALVDRALKLDPKSRDAHFEAARLHLRRGETAEAIREGEAALPLTGDVTDRQVHFLLIQAYRAAGREQEAARHAEAVRRLESPEKRDPR
jgi:tetratricopeptide (TPR) repeat protein